MVTISVAALFAVVGLIVYLASQNPKVAQVALVTYGCGLLVALWHVGSAVAKL
jgi:hypothetical protein